MRGRSRGALVCTIVNQSGGAQRAEEYLRVRIAGLAAGTKLPTERELASALGVGRTALRPALESLRAEGLLERRQGAGTFVAERRQGSAATPLSGELSRRGLASDAVLLGVTTSELPVWAEQAGTATLVRRVRRLSGEPVSLEHSWLPHVSTEQLNREALEHGSLYAELARIGVRPHCSSETLDATLATADEATLLATTTKAALLRIRRLVTDERGLLVEAVQTLLRADRFRLATRVDARGGSGLAAMLTPQPPTPGDPQ